MELYSLVQFSLVQVSVCTEDGDEFPPVATTSLGFSGFSLEFSVCTENGDEFFAGRNHCLRRDAIACVCQEHVRNTLATRQEHVRAHQQHTHSPQPLPSCILGTRQEHISNTLAATIACAGMPSPVYMCVYVCMGGGQIDATEMIILGAHQKHIGTCTRNTHQEHIRFRESTESIFRSTLGTLQEHYIKATEATEKKK